MSEILKPLPQSNPGVQPAATSAAAPRQTYLGYMASVLGGALGALAVFYFLLLALRTTGNLPPPAFTNSLCVDEKLGFLRENPVISPNLLVVGSSVAWRHFDSATVARQSPASGRSTAASVGCTPINRCTRPTGCSTASQRLSRW